MNAVYARRLWLMFRFDLMNAAGLLAFMAAALYGMDLAAAFCTAIGWCA
jgi:hypothetical protein